MSKIALGTWSWGAGFAGGDQVFGNHTDEQDLQPVFDAAFESGLTLWDTATVYGMGESERILGKLIATTDRSRVQISTKFTPQIADMFDNSVEQMALASIRRMNCDYLDMYWIHNPADVERWTPGLIPLLESGKVRAVGVSNHNIDEIRRADEILQKAGYRVSAVQNHFSLIYRSSERGCVLDNCKQNGIQFWAYMTLEQGALTGRFDMQHPLPENSDRGRTYNPILPQLEDLIAVMREIGERHNANPSQIAQAWAIGKCTMPIVGITKPKYIPDTVAATRITLSQDEMARLEEYADRAKVDTRGSWEHTME